MPLLTELLSLDVVDRQGDSAGRLRDLVVAPAHGRPVVVGVALAGGLPPRPLAAAPGEPGSALAVGDGEGAEGLWLARDVLDTQVYDIAGHRVSRVGDVLLELLDGELALVGVEVGLAPVLRRLGLRRASLRARSRSLAWGELHPLSKRGHSLILAHDPQRAHVHLAAARAHRPRLFHHRAPR